ncbi:Cytochrome c biogenesis protein CcsA [compost metagenome]
MNLQQIETLAVTITFISALVAMILFLVEVAIKKPLAKHLGMAGMGVALVGSLVTLVARGIIANHVPWSNLWESMIFMLFGTLVFYFVTEFWYKPKHFGIMAAPLVLILIGGASLLPPHLKGAAPLMPALQSYWIKIHTSAILLSYAAFTISFGTAVAYFVYHWLGNRKPGGPGTGIPAVQISPSGAATMSPPPGAAMVGTAPAPAPAADAAWVPSGLGGTAPAPEPHPYQKQLEFFDELTYRLILIGFPLLMFGIITGAMWANSAWGTYWSWDPKETWSLITWFIYAAYLHARITKDWTGHKAATLAAVGFVSMIITYIGVNYLSSGLHSYGFLR